MNRHSMHYIDLYPEPVEREPSTLSIWIGAAFAMAALWIVCALAFSI